MVEGACTFFTYPPSHPPASCPDGFVLLHSAKPRWVFANRTALEIARSLDRGMSLGDAAGNLSATYGIPSEAARRDVQQVAVRLAREGFLETRELARPCRRPSLDTAFLHVTSRCNLSCLHCYCPHPGRPPDLGFELVCRLIDEVARNGGRGVALSGGEALLHPEIRRILKHAASKLQVRLLTNGTLLDRDWAGFLADLNVQVQISLDGATPEIHDRMRGNGAYRKALRGVTLLQQAGLAANIVLCATITKHNARHLEAILSLAEALGVPLVRFLPLSRRGRAADLWDGIGAPVSIQDHETFYERVSGLQRSKSLSLEVSCGLSGLLLDIPEPFRADGIWCSVGRQAVVDVEGNVFPCVLLMQDSFRLGSVHEAGLADLIRSERMAEACSILNERRSRIPKCRACAWRNFCQAGCMGQALDNTGSVWDTDPFCEYRKKAYARAFDRILEREAARA
ncbi:MAG: PqqD family peptide modification chaperone [bacterium]